MGKLIKFKKSIRLLAKFEDFEQEWEFDVDEFFNVKKIEFGKAKKIKTRPGKPVQQMRFADIFLEDGGFLWMVPEDAFEIIGGKK